MLLRLPYIPIAHTQTHYSLPCIILCCRFRLREKQRNRFFITIAHLSVAVCEHAHTYTATYKPSRDKNYVSLHVYRFFFSCLLYALCIHSSAKRSLYGINVVYFAHISYTNIVDLPQKKNRRTRNTRIIGVMSVSSSWETITEFFICICVAYKTKTESPNEIFIELDTHFFSCGEQ